MKYSEIISEEKVRLDPKCWSGKKIGNPKTKMKGGVRVNNCVPAESVAEGFFGSKENPALPIVNKIASVASRLNAQNVDARRQIIQSHAQELSRMLKQGMAENHNPEYDDEAGMADNNLETLKRAVQGLDNIIQPGDNLPEWCQEKIAVAKSMLVAVWDYMASEEDRGAESELAEEFDMIERIVEGIADYNGVDAEVVWADLESLTEDELYAFAVTSQLNEDWSKVNKKDKTDGMSRKAVKAYRREHPGSKLQTAVTTKPSKLKKGSKASKRRKSYCSRSRGQMKMHNISCAKTPDKAICKARRRWNC